MRNTLSPIDHALAYQAHFHEARSQWTIAVAVVAGLDARSSIFAFLQVSVARQLSFAAQARSAFDILLRSMWLPRSNRSRIFSAHLWEVR